MKQDLYDILIESKDTSVQVAIIALTIVMTLVAIKLLKRFVRETGNRHQMPPARSHVIIRFGQTIIYLVAIVIVSTVLGFGVQGIFFATSSFFAIAGIAFFATWSILSNATASLILYFTFPFRIGDRILIENEPRYCGILTDVTLFYLRIENENGSIITIPANVAIQKIITIQSDADHRLQKLALAAKSDAS